MFRGSLRGSKHSQVVNIYAKSRFPPGLGPSPPVTIANITQLGIQPPFCRGAKKSRHLRMAVSMFSHYICLRAFTYEGVVRSVRCRPRKPIPHRRTWWCTERSLSNCFALSVYITHTYSRVSIILACILLTFSLNEAVSYHTTRGRTV